ncbi:uncharacterized protein LOC122500019 [Leptopilina heterotoma]|uniref:uncharacterized protein LOC122500019 n=1 Tax=Leptopilina heterotoma TaxID=63436 RepID=UPI001CA9C628|nr:uncharacterized protein LOC122500019 [Leptopilina heterotoma]
MSRTTEKLFQMEIRKQIKINAFDLDNLNYVDEELDFVFQSNFHNDLPEVSEIVKSELELSFEQGVTRKNNLLKLKAPLVKPPRVELSGKVVCESSSSNKEDFEEILIKIAEKEEERMRGKETEKIKNILRDSAFPIVQLKRIPSPTLPDIILTTNKDPISKIKLIAKNKIAKQMVKLKPKKPVKKPKIAIIAASPKKENKKLVNCILKSSEVVKKKRSSLPLIIKEEILTTPVVLKKPSLDTLSEGCPQTYDDLFASLQEVIDITEDLPNLDLNVLNAIEVINVEQQFETDLNNNITNFEGSSEDFPIPLPTSMQGRPFRVARLPGGPWVQVPLGTDRFRIPVPGAKWVLRIVKETGLIKHARLVPLSGENGNLVNDN